MFVACLMGASVGGGLGAGDGDEIKRYLGDLGGTASMQSYTRCEESRGEWPCANVQQPGVKISGGHIPAPLLNQV